MFSQKKAYLSGLRKRVIEDIIAHLGIEIINPVESWEDKCMEVIRQSKLY
jgi:hypothetical protein